MAISPKQLSARYRKQLVNAGVKLNSGNKHGASKVQHDSITFDSKAEGLRYLLNKQRIAQGLLAYQLLQVPLRLPGGVKYVVDFIEVGIDGQLSYVDVKGQVTQLFRTKKKQVEALYPIKIQCLRCTDYQRMCFSEVAV